MTVTAVQPAPGWYTDPAGLAGLRWWDGQAWSTHVQTSAASLPPAPPQPTGPTTPPAASAPSALPARGEAAAAARHRRPPTTRARQRGNGLLVGAVLLAVLVVAGLSALALAALHAGPSASGRPGAVADRARAVAVRVQLPARAPASLVGAPRVGGGVLAGRLARRAPAALPHPVVAAYQDGGILLVVVTDAHPHPRSATPTAVARLAGATHVGGRVTYPPVLQQALSCVAFAGPTGDGSACTWTARRGAVVAVLTDRGAPTSEEALRAVLTAWSVRGPA